MAETDDSKLSRLHDFFTSYGPGRLDGLDRSYFAEMTPGEQAQAWDFLLHGFPDSVDHINGLYLLDKVRAIALFKKELDAPVPPSEFTAERKEIEINRLLMLRYVTHADDAAHYLAMLPAFARSEFEEVRTQFAQSLSSYNATSEAVIGLKGMIHTETERLPLASAITALMDLHGMSYDPFDLDQRSIYMLLRSSEPDEKRTGISRLEAIRPLAGKNRAQE